VEHGVKQQVAADLRAAADHIERVGWVRKTMYSAPRIPQRVLYTRHGKTSYLRTVESARTSPCCVLGALGVVTGALPTTVAQPPTVAWERYYLATDLLTEQIGRVPSVWNDDALSVEVILGGLRKAARALEQEAVEEYAGVAAW
jgi:hypothetical protein